MSHDGDHRSIGTIAIPIARRTPILLPLSVDPAEVRDFLETRPGVASIHDFHVWPMSTTEFALTCHLVMPAGHPGDAFLHGLAAEIANRFKIGHSTLQIETDPHGVCALAPDEVV